MAGPSQEASGERNQICSNFGFSLVAFGCKDLQRVFLKAEIERILLLHRNLFRGP